MIKLYREEHGWQQWRQPWWCPNRDLTCLVKSSWGGGGSVAKSCLTLCDPMDPPGSSVHGISQARTLEGVAMPSSRGLSPPIGRWVLYPLSHQGSPKTSWYLSIFLHWSEVKVAQLCPTLCDPIDYTVHGILKARILEWVAFPFSRRSSQPQDRTQVSRIAGGFFTSWTSREAQKVAQLCLTLCKPMDRSPPGSSVRGILRARILEWVPISFLRVSSQPRDQTQVSCIAGRFFTFWATREALILY